uniref:Uncharacterized protein n=1 Tax=viral metagenome TaxID=1070528 RepID=A0A6M3L009_9ZZZZ
MKIINLLDRCSKKENQWAVDTFKVLHDSPVGDDIVTLILEIIVKECEIGLGLLDIEDGDDLDLYFFKRVHDVFQQAAGDCYFCRDLDPNDIRVDKDTQVCPMCRKKLANFLRFIGVNPGSFLVGEK